MGHTNIVQTIQTPYFFILLHFSFFRREHSKMLPQLPQLRLLLPNPLALAPAPRHRSQPLQRDQVVERRVPRQGLQLERDETWTDLSPTSIRRQQFRRSRSKLLSRQKSKGRMVDFDIRTVFSKRRDTNSRCSRTSFDERRCRWRRWRRDARTERRLEVRQCTITSSRYFRNKHWKEIVLMPYVLSFGLKAQLFSTTSIPKKADWLLPRN